jgi:hypothetical protein
MRPICLWIKQFAVSAYISFDQKIGKKSQVGPRCGGILLSNQFIIIRPWRGMVLAIPLTQAAVSRFGSV